MTAVLLSKEILLKCWIDDDRYSSAGVCGLCVGIFRSFARLAFVCWLCVPCKCAKNSVGSGWQSHVSLNLSRMLFRVTYNDRGFAKVWNLKFVRPVVMPIRNRMMTLRKSSLERVQPPTKAKLQVKPK